MQICSGGFHLTSPRQQTSKSLKFLWERSSIWWITTTLQTVKSKNLQDITTYLNSTLQATIGEEVHLEWQNLDQLLVQFWNTYLICPHVVNVVRNGGKDIRDCVLSLLLELTKRGLVNLVGINW